MNKLRSVVAMLLLLATFTTPAMAAKKTGNAVRYTVLHNYFHNNDAPMPSSPLITTQKDFEAQFGMATRMGEGGQPTPVNFKKQAVLAIVLPVTDKSTDIDSVTVTQSGKDELTLAYTVSVGAGMGYSVQPIYLMAIDGKYKGFSVKAVPAVHEYVSVNSGSYETISLSDTRHNMDLTVDFPTDGNKNVVGAVRGWLSARFDSIVKTYSLADTREGAAVPRITATIGRQFVEQYALVLADSMDKVDNDGRAFDNPNRCSLTASMTRVFEDGQFVSYEATGYMYMGGAHGLGFCYGATFDKATGRQVELVKDAPALLKLVDKRLHRDMELDSTFHFEQDPLPMPQATPYVVSGGKIKFVYQHYEIGAYALGMPSCEFYPYEIEDYLTEAGRKLEK